MLSAYLKTVCFNVGSLTQQTSKHRSGLSVAELQSEDAFITWNSGKSRVNRYIMPGSDCDEQRSQPRISLVDTIFYSEVRVPLVGCILGGDCHIIASSTSLSQLRVYSQPIAAQSIMNINHIKISRVYQFHPGRQVIGQHKLTRDYSQTFTRPKTKCFVFDEFTRRSILLVDTSDDEQTRSCEKLVELCQIRDFCTNFTRIRAELAATSATRRNLTPALVLVKLPRGS